jgi:hypothetical protein
MSATMLFDPTPVLNIKHRWSSCRNENLNQESEPEFLDEIGSKKSDRSAHSGKTLGFLFSLNIGIKKLAF